MIHTRFFKVLAVSAGLAGLSACGGDDSNNSASSEYAAIVQTVAADFSGSDVQVVDLQTYEVSQGVLPQVGSDYVVESHNEKVFQIGRFGIDTIAAYDIAAIDSNSGLYEYSLKDSAEDDSANSQAMVFASSEKAYVVRYGENNVWIVNPNATEEASFKLGELDLSAYADDDGLVEASAAIIVDDVLYVAMQRLNRNNNFSPVDNRAWVAVFDIATDEEIDTDLTDDESNLKGIELPIYNVGNFDYHQDAGLMVQGIGDPWGAAFYGRAPGYVGGVVKIDTVDYSLETVVDDGDDENHPYGHIANFAIVDEDNLFFVGQAGYQNTNLYHVNLSTDAISAVNNTDFQEADLTSLAVDPEGQLWVGVGSEGAPKIVIIDPTEVDYDAAPEAEYTQQDIGLLQNPRSIRFAESN